MIGSLVTFLPGVTFPLMNEGDLDEVVGYNI